MFFTSQEPAPKKDVESKEVAGRGPSIPGPAKLPPALEDTGPTPKSGVQSIVKDQAQMRKNRRDEAKAAAAAKEAEKATKLAQKEEKERQKEERKRAREEKQREKQNQMVPPQAPATKGRKRQSEPAVASGHSDAKPHEKKPTNKRQKATPAEKQDEHDDKEKPKKPEPAQKAKKPAHETTEKPEKSRRTKMATIAGTPCKVWDPHGKTPKKVKERRKREDKAKQSLLKLQRQKELIPTELADLPEPKDEDKMILNCTIEKNILRACVSAFYVSSGVHQFLQCISQNSFLKSKELHGDAT